MLTFIIYFARRKRPYVWAPAVDLSDPMWRPRSRP